MNEAYSRFVDGVFKLREFAALIVDLEMPNGLSVDEIEIRGNAVSFDSATRHVEFRDSAELEARISAESLRRMLERELPTQVRNPQVSLKDGMIEVTVNVSMIVVLDVVCGLQLRIRDDAELWVDLVSVDKPGIVAGIIEAQLGKINPVFRAQDLPIPVRLESVSIGDRVCLLARADLSTLELPK